MDLDGTIDSKASNLIWLIRKFVVVIMLSLEICKLGGDIIVELIIKMYIGLYLKEEVKQDPLVKKSTELDDQVLIILLVPSV